ncbi:MAG TPA: hypothetical protein IAA26_01980 [Candidatus Blautia faecipullorum]|nr:hypothetical protein [Candidatus Blautia faecipullorum]
MKKIIITIAILSVICTAVCFFLYEESGSKAILAAAITFLTTAYHFLMRLAVGFMFDRIMANKADYTKRWYQCKAWEKKIYKRLNVKHWKRLLPTYDTSLFDPKKHSWDEIAQASCQAELVHETIVLLSFIPIVFSIRFGAVMVFIITSVLAALFDLAFVMIQRYNRPRIIRLIGR